MQPAGLHGDITQIAPLTLANTRQAIVELGIASDGEIDEALAELDALAQSTRPPRACLESCRRGEPLLVLDRAGDESLPGGSS